MKIIFLDIDGVLCLDGGSLDPYRLGLLSRVVRDTGAKVVISSSWRFYPKDLERVQTVLPKWGIPVVGVTKDLVEMSDRLDEILDWLGEHQVRQWVAIDDCELTLDGEKAKKMQGHFVQTNEEYGLMEKEAAELTAILMSGG